MALEKNQELVQLVGNDTQIVIPQTGRFRGRKFCCHINEECRLLFASIFGAYVTSFATFSTIGIIYYENQASFQTPAAIGALFVLTCALGALAAYIGARTGYGIMKKNPYDEQP